MKKIIRALLSLIVGVIIILNLRHVVALLMCGSINLKIFKYLVRIVIELLPIGFLGYQLAKKKQINSKVQSTILALLAFKNFVFLTYRINYSAIDMEVYLTGTCFVLCIIALFLGGHSEKSYAMVLFRLCLFTIILINFEVFFYNLFFVCNGDSFVSYVEISKMLYLFGHCILLFHIWVSGESDARQDEPSTDRGESYE